jgi:serine/threonine-protein kinase HipA
MLNKDNHARNTAVQRDFKGHIALTPLYDFAPMYLHPDGITRRIRWDNNDNGQPDWSRVLDGVCELGAQVQKERRRKGPTLIVRDALAAGIKAMEPALRQLAADGEAMGLETAVINHLRPSILARADELAALT